MTLRHFLAALALLCGALPIAAQTPDANALPIVPDACRSEQDARLGFGLCPDGTFDFYAGGERRGDVPTPEQVLGYPLGSWHTTYGRMERYIAALAEAAPERVRLFEYGRSVERQTQWLVAVGGESTIARLDGIRAAFDRLTDPRATSAAEADRLIADLPAVVWLNAANDGNESAAFEAVLQIAYQMAAGEDARTRLLRDSTLVLVNLAHNPESHERFVAWYNAFVMGDPDPAALEHDAPWGMNTNNNHYQFDLNRDALGLTQTETRNVARAMRAWHPQVFVDLHGQTTQYFFPPPATPVNPVYPDHMNRWWERFGEENARAFDAFGWSYYVRDVFDLYYPGYWDTYPALHGATGMTYETDGGGGKGVRWRRDDGTILSFRDGIAHHFVASMTTIETAARNRTERLRDYRHFYEAGIEKGRTGGIRTVVIDRTTGDAGAADRLASILIQHGLEVARTTRDATITATHYLNGRRAQRALPAGSYVVDLAQPLGLLAHTLLVPSVELPRDFAEQELAKIAANARRAPGEHDELAFYDVTAWNLPLALGAPAAWSAEALALPTSPLEVAPAALEAPGGWEGEVVWPRTGGTAGRAASAYVWPAGTTGAVRLLARLMGEGFNVAVSSRALVVDGRDFPRGSFIARVGRNPESLHARIDRLAGDAGVDVYPAASAFPARGAVGTGSETTRSLAPPDIAVVTGEGVSVTSYGALWFNLERRVYYPFTALRGETLADLALDRFEVIVLPSGSYGNVLGDAGAAALKAWVERGGTLVAYAGGARWIQRGEFGVDWVVRDTTPIGADSARALAERLAAAAPADAALPPTFSPGARPDDVPAVPGALLRTRLDGTHWLTTGYETDELAVLARSLPLRASESGANPVVYADGARLVASGFVWPELTEGAYAGRSYATVDAIGDGRIILFADDPLHRGVFDAPAGLLWNAIFLGAPGRRDAER